MSSRNESQREGRKRGRSEGESVDDLDGNDIPMPASSSQQGESLRRGAHITSRSQPLQTNQLAHNDLGNRIAFHQLLNNLHLPAPAPAAPSISSLLMGQQTEAPRRLENHPINSFTVNGASWNQRPLLGHFAAVAPQQQQQPQYAANLVTEMLLRQAARSHPSSAAAPSLPSFQNLLMQSAAVPPPHVPQPQGAAAATTAAPILTNEMLRELLLHQQTSSERQHFAVPPPAPPVHNQAHRQLQESAAREVSEAALREAPRSAVNDPSVATSTQPARATSAAAALPRLEEPAQGETSNPKGALTGRPPVNLFTDLDAYRLTPYQCLAREQIEYFEATLEDVEGGAQGRNKAIVLGQVGIRCRHCKHLPRAEKAAASAFYPSKLSGLYQAAQNIANSHIAKDCQKVPKPVREKLLSLGNRKSAPGGGKAYWADEAEKAGIMEDEHGLRFLPKQKKKKARKK